jgi:tyrosyl-tRNA synthetase
VKIDGEKISDTKLMLAVGSQHVYQVGKRKFAKVEVV